MVFQTSTQNEKSKQVIFRVNSGFSDVSTAVIRGKRTPSLAWTDEENSKAMSEMRFSGS